MPPWKTKEPKEAIIYPASKRKAPPFKPLRPSKFARTASAADSEPSKPAAPAPKTRRVQSATAVVRKASTARRKVDDEEDDVNEEDGRGGVRRKNDFAKASNLISSDDDKDDDDPVSSDDDEITADPRAAAAASARNKSVRSVSKDTERSHQQPANRPPAKPMRSVSNISIPSLDDSSDNESTPPNQPPISLSDDDGDDYTTTTNPAQTPLAPSPQIPTLPRPLLIRLLHESFAQKSTQIDAHALQVLQKYVEIFVREAMARAAQAKEGKVDRGEAAWDDRGWLEVEDLEGVAGGLLGDF